MSRHWTQPTNDIQNEVIINQWGSRICHIVEAFPSLLHTKQIKLSLGSSVNLKIVNVEKIPHTMCVYKTSFPVTKHEPKCKYITV